MNKDLKKSVVPALRFPEFRDEEMWETSLFGDIYVFKVTNSFTRDDLNYEHGEVKNIHYGDIHTKFSTSFYLEKEKVPFINTSILLEKIKSECYCMEGDMVFADASEDLNDIGKCIEIISLNNEKVLSGLHTILARQISSKLIVGFGGYLFQSNGIRIQIQKESQGTKVLGISVGRLSNIVICYPQDKVEQKKIADCLSSVDDLINAQSEKIETLKKHKKGLMQQLFPAEGETLPQLRFPEFQDSEEWEEKILSEIGEVLMCKRIFAEETKNEGEVPFFKIGTLGGNPDAYISKELFDKYKLRYNFPRKGEILITCSGTVGKCQIYDGLDAYYQDSNIVWIDNPTLELSNELIYYMLSNVNWKKLNSTTIVRIYGSDLRNLPFIFPKNLHEQQKIAECLTTLDDLIAAENEKLTILKAHKKGLMQQLFPNTNEIE